VVFQRHLNIPEGSTIYVDFGSGRVIGGRVVRSSAMGCGVQFDRRLAPRLAIELGVMEGPVQIALTPSEEVEKLYPQPEQTLPHWLGRTIGRVRRA
jgi:hypothetical protein